MTDEHVLVTEEEPATMSPAVRALRTLLQAVAGVLLALVGVGVVDIDLTAEQTTLVTGALVALASAAHNVYNQVRASRRRA